MTTKTQELIKSANYQAGIAFSLLSIALLLSMIVYLLIVRG